MLQPIRDRGPDSEGVWSDQGVVLGHRRLAIIDLTAAGRQPMSSRCGRYVLTYNGEIYNAAELRAEVEQPEGIPWRGHSDTETLLECIARYGLIRTLPKLNGMFALGVWDRRERTLSIARDRFGEKPLYFMQSNTRFTFASELSCFEAAGDFDLEINRCAVQQYFDWGYIPEENSIYRGISKLSAGSSLTWKLGTLGMANNYWSAAEVFEHGLENRISDPGAAIEALDYTLSKACRLRMTSDVPLGVFLSGGLDSSAVTAMAQRAADRPVKTFSIGVDDPMLDEAPHASAVAAYLGTEHHTKYVTSQDLLNVIQNFGTFTDEPFADSSLIPTYLISRLTREHVTVVLTGDGGDELFGGYPRYATAQQLWRRIQGVPSRDVLARIITCVSKYPLKLDSMLTYARPLEALRFKLERVGAKLGARSLVELHDAFCRFNPPSDLVISDGANVVNRSMMNLPASFDALKQLRYADMMTFLPSDLLVKVDRASMRNSLEGRMPYLDPEVFELSCRLDSNLMQKKDVNKWILREMLYRLIPKSLIDRPKQGFSVPIDSWLRGPLRSWALDLLDRRVIVAQGILNPEAVEGAKHKYFIDGQANHLTIWSLLAFQMWLAARKRRNTLESSSFSTGN
jgi:asparagine synthase (glutamine-hydrolysing)